MNNFLKIVFSRQIMDDREVQRRNEQNKANLRNGVVMFPFWSITETKRALLVYHFKDGSVQVKLQHVCRDAELFELVLEEHEWTLLRREGWLIGRFINAVNGRGKETPEDVLKYWYIKKADGEWKSVLLHLYDHLKITLKWNPQTKESVVDIRRGGYKLKTDCQTSTWIGDAENGISFSGTEYKDYFKKCIVSKIDSAISMWSHMHGSGYKYWKMCMQDF
jgi:hypothetical protein